MEATIKSYIEQLIDLQLVKPGDRVFCDTIDKYREHCRREDAPHGWGVVADTQLENRALYVKFDEQWNHYGVYVGRIIDWKPAEGRTKEEGNEDREMR